MTDINYGAEVFAVRIYNGVSRRVVALYNKGKNVTYDDVRAIVSGSVCRHDCLQIYTRDAKMVDYVTNSVCSSFGI